VATGASAAAGEGMYRTGTRRLDSNLTARRCRRMPAKRVTHLPADGIHVLSYSFEEVFAEKMRALAARRTGRLGRPAAGDLRPLTSACDTAYSSCITICSTSP
jgi:hypothetical protein